MKHLVTILCFYALVAASASGQELPAGPQVLTFFSGVDDTEQPYGIYLPKGYDPSRKYPLVIMLHGAGSNHRLALRRVFGHSNGAGESDLEASQYFPAWDPVDYIVATPFARGTMGYQGIAEKDVYDVLADVRKRFSTDEDRTYLTGLSMGGGGTLWIGLSRPDVWAALAPVCPAPPRRTDELLVNGLSLPFYFFHGEVDRVVPVTIARDWVRRIREAGGNVRYDEYPGVEHNSWEKAYAGGAIFRWFSEHKRDKFPLRVRFNTRSHAYNKAYWVLIDHIVPGALATVDASFAGDNEVTIRVENTKGISLVLAGHPRFSPDRPVKITINGARMKPAQGDTLSFREYGGKWSAGRAPKGPLVKGPLRDGPIYAAFSDRHTYVYGTRDNPDPAELRRRIDAATHAGNWSVYRNAFLGRIMVFPRIIADKDVRPSDEATGNLILFGTRATNSVIEKYSDRLPLDLPAADGDVGLLYVYPVNGRYVVINSGIPWWSGANDANPVLPYTLLPSLMDFVVYRGALNSPVAEGYFDDEWKVPPTAREKLLQAGVKVR